MPKPSKSSRTHILHLRLSKKEHDDVMRAAKLSYLDKSNWARSVLLKEIERLDEERSRSATR